MLASMRARTDTSSKNLPIEQLYWCSREFSHCQQRKPSMTFNGQQSALAGAA